MNWDALISEISPHVVRISTPTGYGTGFLAFYNHDASWCGIATAAHVVAHADEWQQPIRITVEGNGSTICLGSNDRIIFLDRPRDSAVVFFVKGNLNLPQVPITLLPANDRCAVGSEVGWLGYPEIDSEQLCFFAGTVSARKDITNAYLIDGVAINGVSGGPVFHGHDVPHIQIVGSTSAYFPNMRGGQALPGLMRAQDISHFQDSANKIQSTDQEAKQRFEEEQRKKAEPQSETEKAATPKPKDTVGAGAAKLKEA